MPVTSLKLFAGEFFFEERILRKSMKIDTPHRAARGAKKKKKARGYCGAALNLRCCCCAAVCPTTLPLPLPYISI
jgi:hypothetical protein